MEVIVTILEKIFVVIVVSSMFPIFLFFTRVVDAIDGLRLIRRIKAIEFVLIELVMAGLGCLLVFSTKG
jgi:hypothetical protein